MTRRSIILLAVGLSACTSTTMIGGDSTSVASTCDLVGVAIRPSQAKIFVGDTLLLSVAVPGAGCHWNVAGLDSLRIRYSSSDTRVATVDSIGTVRGHAPGHATITAAPVVDTTAMGAMLVDVSARP